MTEKYILTGKVQFGRQYQITDSETNYAYKNNKSDKQKICDLLNKLTDENEQLKIKLEDIALENENAKESNDDAQYELYKLKKENEQLKQDRKRLIGYLWKYKSMDMEEIEEYILSRELLDEYGEVIMNE